MDLQELQWERMDLIHQAQEGDYGNAAVTW